MKAFVNITNASKSYDQKVALNDLTLSISMGDKVAIIGPNGGGKTTLLRAICRMLDFDNPGSLILFDDPNISEIKSRQMIYILPDDDSLIENLTGREFFQLIASTYKQGQDSIDKAVNIVRQLDFEISNLDKLIKTYSHGMRKKIQIASLWIPKCKLYIIDEPTNGLDPTSIILVRELLKDFETENSALIISSHNMSFTEQLANKILLLNQELRFYGTPKELLKSTQTKTVEDAYIKLMIK